MVYQSTGENALAEAQFQAALKADPSLSRARNNYAAFLYSQGRFVEAEREFDRVTGDTLYSGRPMAFVNSGLESIAVGSERGGGGSLYASLIDGSAKFSLALLEMGFLRLEAGDTERSRAVS